MFSKCVRKIAVEALFWAVAGLVALLPSASLGASIADLERLSASGTPLELKAAFSEISADIVFPSGNGPLHLAAEHASDPAVIEVLVNHGAPLSSEGLEKLTPLMLAAAYNPNASITEALIKALAGNGINSADKQGRTPLHFAAVSNESPEVARALLRHGANANVRDRSGKTPLWMAANRSDARIVRLLLDAGARVNDPNDDGVTPLLVASEKPDAAVLRFLMEAGADPDIRGKNRYTPLMSAVAAGADLDAIMALIEGNADVNAEDDQNRSAIHLLASRHNPAPDAPKILFALTSAGANPNAMDSSLLTPLMEACKQKNTVMVETLLKAGARVDLRDRSSWTALLHAASKGAPLEIYELLKKAGADIDGATRQGASPLMVAMDSKVGELGLKPLLDAGANPNHKGYDTVSVLMSAIAAYDLEVVKTLLEYGADPNQTTWDGLSPMMLAAQRVQDAALFETLVANGADVDSRSNQGVTALMVAATSGNIAAIESLIAMGADLEIKDLDGLTPLFHAVQSSEEIDGVIDIVDLLLNGRSDVNAQDISGSTPLMHAALGGKHRIAGRLLDAGAGMDITDSVGWTALHFVARSDAGVKAAEILIEKMLLAGKSVDVPDNGGTTPLMVAAAYNNAAIVRLLIQAGANFSRQDKTGRNAYEYASMKNASHSRDAIKEAIEESQRVHIK